VSDDPIASLVDGKIEAVRFRCCQVTISTEVLLVPRDQAQ
jgi:hypothetical protein